MKSCATLRSIYQAVDDEAFAELERRHTSVTIPMGTVYHHAGTVAGGYVCIATGLMRSSILDSKGNDHTTEFFEPGELAIDTTSMFLRKPASESIIAVTKCTGFAITYEAFQALFHEYNSIREWGRTWMSHRYFSLKQRTIASFLGINESTLSRISARITPKRETK